MSRFVNSELIQITGKVKRPRDAPSRKMQNAILYFYELDVEIRAKWTCKMDPPELFINPWWSYWQVLLQYMSSLLSALAGSVARGSGLVGVAACGCLFKALF